MNTLFDAITHAAGVAPRRAWVSPQVILGACKDSEAGSDVYQSDFTTTDGSAFNGS